MKSFDAKTQREAVESIERLAAACGFTWYKGMHPEAQIHVLVAAFTELDAYKNPKRTNVLQLAAPVKEL